MAHGTTTQTAVSFIVSSLEEEIIFGSLLPKQRLYEDELILRFNTKRHIVRAALQELERRGIVDRAPNRGAAVRFYTRQEVEDLYVLRQILHEAAAKLIQLPADSAWLKKLKKAQQAHSEAINNHNLSAIFSTNNFFHQVLFEGTRNPSLTEAIEFSNAKTHGIRSHGLKVVSLLQQAESEHYKMIEAIENDDRDTLVLLCLTHMRPARQFYEDKYCVTI
ncbi:MAG: GntR family transcriptional regulator [Gammaproteobacteria bacterium]|nr:GntR family transcriptional regulator [Gammaproteobacteria bacterium]